VLGGLVCGRARRRGPSGAQALERAEAGGSGQARRCTGAEAELARRSARGTRRVRECVEAGSCERWWRRRNWSAGGGMWRAGGRRRRAEFRARGW
jgi:hypothetical protein